MMPSEASLKDKIPIFRKTIWVSPYWSGACRGNWQVISEIINQELQGEDFALVKYVPDWKSGGRNIGHSGLKRKLVYVKQVVGAPRRRSQDDWLAMLYQL